jgi:hypothetical protein
MLNDAVLVAIITASGGILVAALTFYLTKRHESKVEWQHEKLNHYKALLSALSDLATDGTDKDEAYMRLVMAVNTIALVAPQYVIDALMAFHDEIKLSNPDKSSERLDKLLVQLLLTIRKEIGLAAGDNRDTFRFHLVSFVPSKNKSRSR